MLLFATLPIVATVFISSRKSVDVDEDLVATG